MKSFNKGAASLLIVAISCIGHPSTAFNSSFRRPLQTQTSFSQFSSTEIVPRRNNDSAAAVSDPRRCVNRVKLQNHRSSESEQTSMQNGSAAGTSRRSALLRCSSAFMATASTIFSTTRVSNANAAELSTGFSESPISNGVIARVGDPYALDALELPRQQQQQLSEPVDNSERAEQSQEPAQVAQATSTEQQTTTEPASQESQKIQMASSAQQPAASTTAESGTVKMTTQAPSPNSYVPPSSYMASSPPDATLTSYPPRQNDQGMTSSFSKSSISSSTRPNNDIVSKQLESLANNPKTKSPSPPSSPKTQAKSSSEEKEVKTGHLLELALGVLTVGGTAITMSVGRDEEVASSNEVATGSPKVKVVMVQPDPYGLDQGRNWYKGVDVTINRPRLAHDVRAYCDAEKGVTSECAESIVGYLGSVPNLSDQEKDETASVIISYLESLSNGGGRGGGMAGGSTETAAAFSSYVEGVSRGSIPGPSSAESVVDYLGSLANKSPTQVVQNSSAQSYSSLSYGATDPNYNREDRLSKIESRMNRLESSVNHLPDQISDRLQQWQQTQDEKLSDEMAKIVSYLVDERGPNNDVPVNGQHLPL